MILERQGRGLARGVRAPAILSRAWRSPRRRIVVLVLVLGASFLLGALHASDYGQSWDDPGDAAFGRSALRAYSGSMDYQHLGDRKYYGPLYFVLAEAVSQLAHIAAPAWQPPDIRHALNFGAFLVALLAFYGLAQRLLSHGPAILATLLLALQPVFFGHAFINQKDIPFMAAFTLAVFLGWGIADGEEVRRPEQSTPSDERREGSGPSSFLRGWRVASWKLRGLFLLSVLAGLLVWADLLWGRTILTVGERLLESAYRGEAWGPVQGLYEFVAQDAYKTPFIAYAARLDAMFSWLRMVLLYLAALPAVVTGLALVNRAAPAGPSLRHVMWRVLPAAFVLGAAMAIRVAGLFAGLLASFALLTRMGRRSAPDLIVYWTVALSACFLAWPYLWDAPVARFLEAARLLARFPSHPVLFRGAELSSANLPWDYLPSLLAIQLTETALLLIGLGLLGILPSWRQSRNHRILLAILATWFLVPFLASTVFRASLYGNFRQVFFALPPLFVLAGLGIDLVWKRLQSPGWRFGFGLVVLLPGIIGIRQLHPYEYVYYNAFTGGVKGAEGEFAHDYWCTSYREAMAYINAHAPPGARIAIAEPFEVAADIARPDLELVQRRKDPQAFYLLRCNDRGDLTLRNLRDFPLAFAVTRAGVILGVVLQPDAGIEAEPESNAGVDGRIEPTRAIGRDGSSLVAWRGRRPLGLEAWMGPDRGHCGSE